MCLTVLRVSSFNFIVSYKRQKSAYKVEEPSPLLNLQAVEKTCFRARRVFLKSRDGSPTLLANCGIPMEDKQGGFQPKKFSISLRRLLYGI